MIRRERNSDGEVEIGRDIEGERGGEKSER